LFFLPGGGGGGAPSRVLDFVVFFCFIIDDFDEY